MATKSGTIQIKTHKQKIVATDKTLFVTIPVRYSTIKANELVEAAARNNCIPVSYIETACAALSNEFYNFILKGHSVKVPQVGTFRLSLRTKSAKEEDGAIDVKRTRILLHPSKELNALLDRVTFARSEKIEEQIGEEAGE